MRDKNTRLSVQLVTMLAVRSSEPGRTQTRAVDTFAVAATHRVLTLCVWHIALLTFPAGVTDAPTGPILAVTVTQRRTDACINDSQSP